MSKQTDTSEPSLASAGCADGRLVEQAFKDLIEQLNEASRSHAMNYTGLLYALLLKGVLSVEEVEAGRQKARAVVDEHFGPTPEAKKAAALSELFERLRRKS